MKKGFTLIELLAVIVILAIIALIVTPVISKVINGAKQRTAVVGSQNYVDSVNKTYALSMLDSRYDYLKDKDILETGFDDNELNEIEVSGKKPTYIKIEYDKTKNVVKEGKFCIDGVSVDYINGVANKSENDYCNKKVEPGLYDKDNNLIVTWDSLVNDYGMDLNWVTKDTTKYFEDDNGWYYKDASYNKVYVQLSEITSSSPNIIFAKNNFAGMSKLIISGSVGEIPEESFYNFSHAIDIVFPKGITKIGVNSFYHSNITGVTFGPDVNEICSSAFDETANLKSMIIPDNVVYFSSNDDWNWGGLNGSGVETIKISRNMTNIPNSFCQGCNNLKSIDIPSNIKIINRNAFYTDRKLSSVTFHEGLEKIDEWAFSYDDILKNVVLPNSLTELGDHAFYDSGIESVAFGTGLIEIPHNAFRLNKIKSVILPSNIKRIGDGAFEQNPIQTLALGNVEEIGDYAFAHDYENVAALKSVVVPASVKKIGVGFIQASNVLENVTFENPSHWTKSEFGKLPSGGYGYTEKCIEVDVSTSEKVLAYMASNDGKLPYLTHWNSLSECQ